MDIINFQIAGIRFQIKLHKQKVPLYTKDFFIEMVRYHLSGFINYQSQKKPDICIDIEDVPQFNLFRFPKSSEQYCGVLFNKVSSSLIKTSYSISFSHFMIMLQRIIVDYLAKHNGFILHASSAIAGGKCYVFVGQSGAGKSTIIKLAYPYLNPFTDDILIIVKEKKDYVCYQTPFVEKESWISKQPNGFPVGKIYNIIQSSQTRIGEQIVGEEKVNLLISQLTLFNPNKQNQIKNLLKWTTTVDVLSELYFENDPTKIHQLLRFSYL